MKHPPTVTRHNVMSAHAIPQSPSSALHDVFPDWAGMSIRAWAQAQPLCGRQLIGTAHKPPALVHPPFLPRVFTASHTLTPRPHAAHMPPGCPGPWLLLHCWLGLDWDFMSS